MPRATFISDLISTGVSGVYVLISPNDKIYVGSSVDIRARWHRHRSMKHHKHLPITNALAKYRPENFTWDVLEEVPLIGLTVEEKRIKLMEREQYWLDSLRPYDEGVGYNLCPTAYSPLGRKQTGKAAAGVPRPNRQGVSIPQNGDNQKGSRNTKARWCVFTDPQGRTFTRKGIGQFSRSRGLNSGAMAAIARGAYKTRKNGTQLFFYKKWTVEYIEGRQLFASPQK